MIPDLSLYDILLLNTSGGKDSQSMLRYVVELADSVGVRDRITAVHADLGRMEWDGTRELAELQASIYGVPFIVVANKSGDLLAGIERRGMFPDSARRFCTSDWKRGPCATVMTRLVREANLGRPARILNCMGMRSQESPARAKKPMFCRNERATGKGRVRIVDDWLPIHTWTADDVWASIRSSGVPYHPVYDQGMPRLSCSFCVLASKGALVRAAQLRPALAAEYAAVESRIGHSFQKNLTMADIIAAASITDTPQPILDWAA